MNLKRKSNLCVCEFVRSEFFARLFFATAVFSCVFVLFWVIRSLFIYTYFHECLGLFFWFSTHLTYFFMHCIPHMFAYVYYSSFMSFIFFYSCNRIKLIMLALAMLLFSRSLLFIVCFSCLQQSTACYMVNSQTHPTKKKIKQTEPNKI